MQLHYLQFGFIVRSDALLSYFDLLSLLFETIGALELTPTQLLNMHFIRTLYDNVRLDDI